MLWSCTSAGEEAQVVEVGGHQQVGLHLERNHHLRLLQAWILDGGVGRDWIDSDLIVAVVVLACVEGALPLERGGKPLSSLLFVEHLARLHSNPGRATHQKSASAVKFL